MALVELFFLLFDFILLGAGSGSEGKALLEHSM